MKQSFFFLSFTELRLGDMIRLTLIALWVKVLVDDILKYVFPEKVFDISCKLSPLEAICMEFQVLFSEKKKKKKKKKKSRKVSPINRLLN